MKTLYIFIALFVISLISAWYFYLSNSNKRTITNRNNLNQVSPPTTSIQNNEPQTTVIAQNLQVPWAIAFLPDSSMLITERKGSIRRADSNGNLDPAPVATLSNVKQIGEGGLLGIALHPNFVSNKYVYLYYTYGGSGNSTFNRVVRTKYEDNRLGTEEIIVDNIPGAANHNGGRIKFGPDGFLYITTGDAQNPSLAQDIDALAGKVLRVTDEGKPAAGNQFGNAVYSYGHRNPQGIAWDEKGQLFETEHGPSGGNLGTGNDEINMIESGKNYGWPFIQGDQTRTGLITPLANSTPAIAWAPSGAAFLPVGRQGLNHSLFFAGLKGQTLYEAVIENNIVKEIKEHFTGEFGRLREVVVGPDGMLYITTSNRDGRGNPQSTDDRIIRVNPQRL